MDWLFGLVIVLLLLVFFVGAVLENRKWVQFYGTAAERPANAVRLQAALRRAGVRHKYQSSRVIGPWTAGAFGRGQTMQILVHRDDLHRAREVLADLDLR